jgi:hypothetical protein
MSIKVVIVSEVGRIVHGWGALLKDEKAAFLQGVVEVTECRPDRFRYASYPSADLYLLDVDGLNEGDKTKLLAPADNRQKIATLHFSEGPPGDGAGGSERPPARYDRVDDLLKDVLIPSLGPALKKLHVSRLHEFVREKWCGNLRNKINEQLEADPLERDPLTMKCKALREQEDCLMESFEQLQSRLEREAESEDGAVEKEISDINLERAFIDTAEIVVWKNQIARTWRDTDPADFAGYRLDAPGPESFVRVNRGILYFTFLRLFVRLFDDLSSNRVKNDLKLIGAWEKLGGWTEETELAFTLPRHLGKLSSYPSGQLADRQVLGPHDRAEPHPSYLYLIGNARNVIGVIGYETVPNDHGWLRLSFGLASNTRETS